MMLFVRVWIIGSSLFVILNIAFNYKMYYHGKNHT